MICFHIVQINPGKLYDFEEFQTNYVVKSDAGNIISLKNTIQIKMLLLLEYYRIKGGINPQ